MLRTESIFEGVPFALAEEMLRESREMRFVARGEGMLPAVFPGEELILHRARMWDVCVGDVVLFKHKKAWHLERVQKILPGVAQPSLLTRADAGVVRKEPVFAEELLGRVAFVVRDGKEKVLERSGSPGQRMILGVVRHLPGAARGCLALHQLRMRIASWWHGAGDLASGRLSGSV